MLRCTRAPSVRSAIASSIARRSGSRQRHIQADVDLATAGEANDVLVLKVGRARARGESGSSHRKGWSPLAESQVSGPGARQIEIPPVEGETGIAAERVPVVNPRRLVALGNLSFAVDAQRALFAVHHRSELVLVEPIEFRARKGHLVMCLRQRRKV